jgi:hypothetical protein
VYHDGLSTEAVEAINPTWKGWDLRRQQEKYAKDILQPRRPDGSINPEYRQAYKHQFDKKTGDWK